MFESLLKCLDISKCLNVLQKLDMEMFRVKSRKSRYIKNGTSDHNFKILKTLFNTNYLPKPPQKPLSATQKWFFGHFTGENDTKNGTTF